MKLFDAAEQPLDADAPSVERRAKAGFPEAMDYRRNVAWCAAGFDLAPRPRGHTTIRFAVVVGASLLFNLCEAHCQTLPSRDAVTTEIKGFADRHARSEAPLATTTIIGIFKDNTAGLTVQEIADIYEKEYDRVRRNEIPGHLTSYGGWIASIILAVVLIFRDSVKRGIEWLIDRIAAAIWSHLAGSRLLRRAALRRYRKSIVEKYSRQNWAFRPNKPLDLRRIFVPLALEGAGRKEQVHAVDTCLGKERRLIIVGAPGAGKSTLLKHLTLKYADGGLDRLADRPTAILFELYRLNDGKMTIEEHLIQALKRHDFPRGDNFLRTSLAKGSLLLLFDALDEVATENRPRVGQQLRDFLDTYSHCRAIITCRSAIYNEEFRDKTEAKYITVEFSDVQIRQFIEPWQEDMPDGKSVTQLMNVLQDRPRIMSLARNPLLLTIIAYLYTDTMRTLPRSRAEFYRRAADVLLEHWNEEHNRFHARHKRAILRHLALRSQDGVHADERDRLSIAAPDVSKQVRELFPQFDMPKNQEPGEILEEIVKRSGLLLEIDGGERLQFSHLTLQEFFAAEQLLNDPEGLIRRFRRDPDSWLEVAKLWCGLAYDSTPVVGAIATIRLYTAFECLADSPTVDPSVSEAIIREIKPLLATAESDLVVARAFGSVASDVSSVRGRQVRDFLEESLAVTDQPPLRHAAAISLSMTNSPVAAELLSRHYDTQDEVLRSSLVRLGDLAVPSLSRLAADGLVGAVDDLAEIATPASGEALVALMRSLSIDVSARAAWRLAMLIHIPEIELALKAMSDVTDVQEVQFAWIWSPFADGQGGDIGNIISRIARLVTTGPLFANIPTRTYIDPRVGVPIAAQLLAQESAGVDKNALRAISTPSVEAGSLRETIIAAGVSERTATIVSSLPPGIAIHLLQRDLNFIDGRSVEEDWRNVLRPIAYSFIGGLHSQLIVLEVACVTLVGAFALSMDLNAYYGLPDSLNLAKFAFSFKLFDKFATWRGSHIAFLVEYSLLSLYVMIPILAIASRSPILFTLSTAPVATVLNTWTIFKSPENAISSITKYLIVAVFASAPFYYLAFFLSCIAMGHCNPFWIILFWVSVIGVASLFWFRGQYLAERAKNKLVGILEGKSVEAQFAIFR